MIDQELLEILACPIDRAPVRLEAEGGAEWILCTRCARKYPVRDGIPVMLAEEAVGPGTAGGGA